jgi:hypothetical protein
MAASPENSLQSALEREILRMLKYRPIQQTCFDYPLKSKEIHPDLLEASETRGERFRGDLSRGGCILALFLRISFYGPSDLLSPLYDASRAQVTSVR